MDIQLPHYELLLVCNNYNNVSHTSARSLKYPEKILPSTYYIYIIRTVKERTFTISGSPTCSYTGLTLNVLNIGQTTKCMPNTIVL